eukprot:52040_1
MNESERKELLVTGYIHGCAKKLAIQIPIDIIAIINMFYPAKFKFQSTHGNFQISEDRLSASSKSLYGTVLFGDFLKQTDKIIYTVQFKMVTAQRCFCGFGFATDKFTAFKGSDYNYDKENHSRIIWYKGGQQNNCWSQEWKSNYFKQHPSFDVNLSTEDWSVGDTVCIEVNMITKTGKIWNKQYPNNITALVDINVESDIAIAVSMGGRQSQKVEVIDQLFQYK